MAIGWLVFIDSTDFLDNLGTDNVKHDKHAVRSVFEQRIEQLNTDDKYHPVQ